MDINTRPLNALICDAGTPGPLTPMHFLRQIGNHNIPEGDVPNGSGPQLQEMYTSQQVALNQFWEVWQNEYIANLPPIVRNRKRGPQVTVGDLVLLRDDPPRPRLCWPMGRVIKLHYGRDNQVRSVDLQMSKGVLTRPVQRLHRLEIHDAAPTDGEDNSDVQETPSSNKAVDIHNTLSHGTDNTNQGYIVTRSGRFSRRPNK